MPVLFLLLMLVSLSILYMWIRRFPIDELEWVIAIIFTLVCYALWQIVILEWLN